MTIVFLLSSVGRLAGALADQNGARTSENARPVQVHLEVQVRAEAVNAILTFANISKSPVYIEKRMTACNSQKPHVNVFQITASGRTIPYTGALVKMAASGPNGYTELNPGKSLQCTVRIDTVYAFLQGTHHYTAQYSAMHGESTNSHELHLFESNVVGFDLTRSSSNQ